MNMKMIACAAALLALTATAYAAEPVVTLTPAQQAAELKAGNAHQVANKKLVYDMWRAFLVAHHLDAAYKYMAPEYHQHNPNAVTGRAGVIAYFKARGAKPMPIPATIPNMVNIVAEGDLVVLATQRKLKDKKGEPYTTTWFDMFRIKNGKIVEHWDCATKM